MPNIVWSPKMYVGIKKIDEQHEHLTQLINDLYTAFVQGKDKEILQDSINSVHEYVNEHFTYEEGLMEENGFPLLDVHQDQHHDFVIKSVDYLMDYADGKEEELTSDVLDYLTNWWVNHINGTDQVMASFLKEKGVS